MTSCVHVERNRPLSAELQMHRFEQVDRCQLWTMDTQIVLMVLLQVGKITTPILLLICVVSLMFIMTKSRWSKSASYKKISPDVSAQRGIRRIFVAHQKLKF